MSMRGIAFVVSGILLALLQGVLYRFWAPFSSVEIMGRPLRALLHGATPNLVLPLVLYLGIVETSMARGAFLAFGLGWAIDIVGGGPAFLFRFSMVAVWGLARSLSSRVSAFSLASRIMLAFLGSLLESSIVLMLLAIFGTDSQRPVDLGDQVIPHALSTALFSPLVFSLAHRLQLESRSSAEVGAGGAGG
jgi:rod shape-determining protein MreD